MKHLMLFTCLLLFTPNTHAGWFFSDPPPPPDLGPEYRARIAQLEDQLSQQRTVTTRWAITGGSLSLGAVLLFVIGTALGASTRKHYERTTRLGRTPAAPGANGARHHLGETDAPARHSTLAA